jgi:hypothetical protein
MLFLAALRLPEPYYPPGACPETGAQRALRLSVIALAIEAETADADGWHEGWSREDWAWMALVKTWWESGRFRLEVHDGRKRGDHGRSVCVGQIMNGGPDLVGTDYESTRRCYREVLRILHLHQMRCRVWAPTAGGVTRVFSGYGSGYACSSEWSSSRQRAGMWARLRAE